MKNKLKRLSVSLLTCITIISSIYTPVFADSSVGSVKEDITNEIKIGQDVTQGEETEYSTLVEGNKYATNVYATLSSFFNVVIPKTIILDGLSGEGNYTVDVNGDISAVEVINVVPDSSFTMSSVNKDSVSAVVSQDKLHWVYNEMDVDASGLVSAEGLTAGSWNGTFNFNIGMESNVHEHIYTGVITKEATCTEDGVKTFTCECGDSYTEVIDALGHNFSTEYVVDVEATCTEAGSKSQHCSRCDARQNVTEIGATGHTSVGEFVTYNGVQYATSSGGCYTNPVDIPYTCWKSSYKNGEPIDNGSFITTINGGNGCPFCYYNSTHIYTQFYSIQHDSCGNSETIWVNYCGSCGLVTAGSYTKGQPLPNELPGERHVYYITRYGLNCDN